MSTKRMQVRTIVLCGGSIDFYSLPVNTNTSNSMIPINGKPVISWIMEDLVLKNITDACIVLRDNDVHLKKFIKRVYQQPENGLNVSIVTVPEGGTILQSLQAGLLNGNHHGPLRVILGDTLIKDSYNLPGDLIYIQEVDDSHRWCLAVLNDQQQVVSYLDKVNHAEPPHYAVCGYYQFSDGKLLSACLSEAIQNGHCQLSDMLALYGREKYVVAKFSKKWLDFGNIDNLVKAKQELLQSRFFNSLQIDPNLNTITKVSTFDEKLRNELNWYRNLPVELQVLTPRIVSAQQVDGRLNLVQEYYGYPTLAELYLFSDLHSENWISIIKKLLLLHQQLCKYPANMIEESFRRVYLDKTINRLKDLKQSDTYWEKMLALPTIEYNGNKLVNIEKLMGKIEGRIWEIVRSSSATIIHGDYCFSNILYDINGQIIRLIDPRGSFGEPGIYGDPRYDVAKLRHSISGLYDYIISDLFELKQDGPIFRGRIFYNETASYLANIFDELVEDLGYKLEDIKFIESLLFISMLPLHKDKPLRQQMMFLRGVLLLNEIFECES